MASTRTVLISGASGLIGQALTKTLQRRGTWKVLPMVRSNIMEGVLWNPTSPSDPIQVNTSVDAIVHLAGAPLQPLWTKKMKRDVRDSRVNGAKALTKLLNELPPLESDRKRTLVCASGIGVYGVKPSDYAGPAFTEQDHPKVDGFLAKVSEDCEDICSSVQDRCRVVFPRFGVVLATHGGAMKEMMLPFKLGLGGPMGDGKQKFAWVSLRDAAEALAFILENDSIEGPVNVVSPAAKETSQRDFAQALGGALRRPTIVPIPGMVLRTIMGKEAAESMLLGSIKVEPKVLLDSGFKFQDTDINRYLKEIV